MNPATAAAFDALGDATRRAMVSLIAQGPVTVSDLAEPLGITLTAAKSRAQRARKEFVKVTRECCAITKDARGRVTDLTPHPSPKARECAAPAGCFGLIAFAVRRAAGIRGQILLHRSTAKVKGGKRGRPSQMVRKHTGRSGV